MNSIIDSMCLNQDEAAMRIRARPLPAPSKGFAPRRSERPLTENKEFRLSSQARHERAEIEFMERIGRQEAILSMNSISARSWRAWLERRNSLFSVRGRSLRRGAKPLEGAGSGRARILIAASSWFKYIESIPNAAGSLLATWERVIY